MSDRIGERDGETKAGGCLDANDGLGGLLLLEVRGVCQRFDVVDACALGQVLGA